MYRAISKPLTRAKRGLHWLYSKLALLAAALLFLFALVSYIRTPWFFPELFTHFQLQLFITCGALFSLLLFMARATKPLVFILLSAALALYPFNLAPYMNFKRLLPGQALEKRVTVNKDHTYRLLQANLFKFNFKRQPMLDLIETVDPDILAVYEMTPEWQQALDNLKDRFPYRFRLAEQGSHGIGLYTRYPIENARLVYMSDENIPAQILWIRLPQGRVRVISLHPRPPTSQNFYINRNQHFQWLKAHVAAGQPDPLIIIGDMNTTMFAPQYKSLVRRLGLQNARRGRGLQNSWFIYGNRLTGIPIDHFLHNDRIRVLESSITPEIKSDHLPLITFFELK